MALQRLMRGRSVILVAHRPALVELADRVIEFDRATVPASTVPISTVPV